MHRPTKTARINIKTVGKVSPRPAKIYSLGIATSAFGGLAMTGFLGKSGFSFNKLNSEPELL